MSKSKIFRDEVIGKKIKIIRSKNPSLKGCEGKIVDETFHTLKVMSDDKNRTIFKKDLVFALEDKDKKIMIEGKNIEKRPEERIKGK